MPPPLEAGDLTALLWAAPSAELAKGVASAPTLMDFAGISANQSTAQTTSLPHCFLSDTSGAPQQHHHPHPHASQPPHAPPHPDSCQHPPSSQATQTQLPPHPFSQAPPPRQLAATQPSAFPSDPPSQQPQLTQYFPPSQALCSAPSDAVPPQDQPLPPHSHLPPASQPRDAPQPHDLPQRPPAATTHLTAHQPKQAPHPSQHPASQRQPAYQASSSSKMHTHAQAQALLQLQSSHASSRTSPACPLPHAAAPHPAAARGAPQATCTSNHSEPYTISAHPQRPPRTQIKQQTVTAAAQPHPTHHQQRLNQSPQPQPQQEDQPRAATGPLCASAPAQGHCPAPEPPDSGRADSSSRPTVCELHELPRWLLEDTTEIAATSSAAAVRLEVALQRRRVAVCFMEDTDVDVECGGRSRTHCLKQGVYDGRVMEVRLPAGSGPGVGPAAWVFGFRAQQLPVTCLLS